MNPKKATLLLLCCLGAVLLLRGSLEVWRAYDTTLRGITLVKPSPLSQTKRWTSHAGKTYTATLNYNNDTTAMLIDSDPDLKSVLVHGHPFYLKQEADGESFILKAMHENSAVTISSEGPAEEFLNLLKARNGLAVADIFSSTPTVSDPIFVNTSLSDRREFEWKTKSGKSYFADMKTYRVPLEEDDVDSVISRNLKSLRSVGRDPITSDGRIRIHRCQGYFYTRKSGRTEQEFHTLTFLHSNLMFTVKSYGPLDEFIALLKRQPRRAFLRLCEEGSAY